MHTIKELGGGKLFILPVISGVLLAFTLPPFNLTWLVWYSLIPLFLFINTSGISSKKVFWGGVVAGVIYFGKVTYPLLSLNAWGWLKVSGILWENKILILFLILSAAVLFSGILLGLFSLLFKRITREDFSPIAPLTILPLCWILFEYLRAKISLGFTWGNLGYALHDSPFLLQLSVFGGVYVLSVLVVFVNIILFFIARETLHHIGKMKGVNLFHAMCGSFFRNPHLYVFIGIILFANVYGYFSIKNLPTILPQSYLSIALVQPGRDYVAENEPRVLRDITKALRKNPAMILIPESAFPSILLNEDTGEPQKHTETTQPAVRSSYQHLIDLSETYSDTSFVVGLVSMQDKSRYSSLVVLEGGHITSIYHKRILFPFSERSVAWFPFKTVGALAEGENAKGITIKGDAVSALICSEILFPKLIKSDTSRFIVAIGTDGVFDSPLVAEQNHIIAKFAAVSTRKYLLRAMKTGVSSIIDPSGRDLVRSRSQEKELLYGEIFP
ncbi:MAG: apolipoprotein N-acyltransferase [Patescibacteria group bacterium]